MGVKNFKDMYLGDFTVSAEDEFLYQLAKKYHDETESYDLIICSAKDKNGMAMPINNWELGKINRNALDVRKRLLKENPCVSPSDLNRAIRRFPQVG